MLDHLVSHCRHYAQLEMVRFCRATVRLAVILFFNLTLMSPTHARSMTFDGKTEVRSSDLGNSQDRNLLPFLESNTSKTDAQGDISACKKAEQLYKAAAEDARILERAIFLSAFRREVERALSRRMTDEELRVLADEARGEAHRWYKVIQSDPRCAASWHGELNSSQIDREAVVGMTEIDTFPVPLQVRARMTAIYQPVPPSHSLLST